MLGMTQQSAINNVHLLHDQLRHQWDFEGVDLFNRSPRGLDTRLSQCQLGLLNQLLLGLKESLPVSSCCKCNNQPKGKRGPLDEFNEMMSALTGYPY
ncbi:hypothetical protein Hanom_Chr05g00426311 [Helianthus anomalus]